MIDSSRRGEVFQYVGYDLDPARNRLICHYRLDKREFREEITFPMGGDWDQPAVAEAARVVFLLAAVSYYKVAAPPVVDLGDLAVTDTERAFLRDFYICGLGEYSYKNALDLSDMQIVGPTLDRSASTAFEPESGRPLVPFGGGMDSLVTVELVRFRAEDTALFIVNRPGDRFDAIERSASLTGLPVVRVERLIDEQLLRSTELGFLNGHVPVTGILSVIAVMAATLERRDAVIMSNEWSASAATMEVAGRSINHQYSKSDSFEAGLRAVLAEAFGGRPNYFSLLRPFSELWIARRFAKSPQYFDHFRSCNRAFYSDRAKRLDHWCGECEKCCFIDLILAPFVDEPALQKVFDGTEPLSNSGLVGIFGSLLGLSSRSKPWECVGEVTECRAAAQLAAGRADRAGSRVLMELIGELPSLPGEMTVEELLRPIGRHFVEDRYAPDDLLV